MNSSQVADLVAAIYSAGMAILVLAFVTWLAIYSTGMAILVLAFVTWLARPKP